MASKKPVAVGINFVLKPSCAVRLTTSVAWITTCSDPAPKSGMRITVLGTGSGGGLLQWTCGCRNSTDARSGGLPSMAQSSLAVSVDGAHLVVLNASPDIRVQPCADPDLAPMGLHGTPVVAVVLTNGDIDHLAGLLTLRQKPAFDMHATAQTLDVPLCPTDSLAVTAFAAPGKVALHLESDDVDPDETGEQTVGLRLQAGGRVGYHIPGCAVAPDGLDARHDDTGLLMFAGTVLHDDEMPSTGTETGARMGHNSMVGEGGSLARLASLDGRKTYVHINNTSPVLQADSPERRTVRDAGGDRRGRYGEKPMTDQTPNAVHLAAPRRRMGAERHHDRHPFHELLERVASDWLRDFLDATIVIPCWRGKCRGGQSGQTASYGSSRTRRGSG